MFCLFISPSVISQWRLVKPAQFYRSAAVTDTYDPTSHARNNRTISFAVKKGGAIYGGSAATGIPTLPARSANDNTRWWPTLF